ncbi:MAG: 1-deoxy-D-xylulose-5-phosphate synthase [Fibrobacter sp.]|nr:1-deoxy-D-xylulose-5-phosphate synthase [Fibrobacter sp.]
MPGTLLETINSPADLKKLPIEKLPQLASEIRDFMIEVVSHTGGHLAPSLGTVELTLALHYCFNSPEDKLIWDVGHQAYCHKIITGRKDRFNTLRQFNGISGFPRTSESEHDILSVGHASTSISGALGFAMGRDILQKKQSVIAIIGDGALTGGLALEGLNNLGSKNTSMTVILNDNEMSISRNVGALSRYLTRVITDKRYTRIKSEIWGLLGGSNVGKSIRSIMRGIDDALKHLVIPGKLFEDMGLRYLGPIDGHNIPEMIEVFNSIKNLPSPQLVHIVTRKGKGYSFAEKDAIKYHGISCFSRDTGEVTKASGKPPTYSEIFGRTMIELASKRSDIVAITAAMPDGTKLTQFSKEFPDRFFDVGIAEGHAVTFAAGLAHQGLRPVIAVYSTFVQRAFDQIMHDVALDKLNVVICLDRAGLVGDDGPTHHGMFDLSFLRSVPGLTIMAPRDENQLRNMLYTAVNSINGPVCIRYPRGCGLGVPIDNEFQIVSPVPEVIRQGQNLAIVSIGDFFSIANSVCENLTQLGYNPTLVDARFAKPLNIEFYTQLFSTHHHIITMENNTITGGFGSAVLELAHTLDIELPRFLRIGLPDEFVCHGDNQLIFRELKLDKDSLTERISNFVKSGITRLQVERA